MLASGGFVILLAFLLDHLLGIQSAAAKFLLEEVIPLPESFIAAGIFWVEQPINEYWADCFAASHDREASNEAPVDGSQREVVLALQLAQEVRMQLLLAEILLSRH